LHTVLELLNAGYEIVVVDNLCNSKEESLRRIQQLTGKSLVFYKVDLLDRKNLDTIFARESIESVIHFAGLKVVSESVKMPAIIIYYGLFI
jgi:UDP-glucose 4-epimerase